LICHFAICILIFDFELCILIFDSALQPVIPHLQAVSQLHYNPAISQQLNQNYKVFFINDLYQAFCQNDGLLPS